MSNVRVYLCANGTSISSLHIDTVDTSNYSRVVSIDDFNSFSNAAIFFLGAAHGCRSLPQFADVVFTVEFDGDLTEVQELQVDGLLMGTETFMRKLLGDSAFSMDIDNRVITALVPKKH